MKLQELFESKAEYIERTQGVALDTAYNDDRGAAKPFINGSPPQVAQKVIKYLSKISDTYLQWVANQYIKHQFSLEDYQRVSDYLKTFDEIKPKLEKKDINAYDYRALQQLVSNAKGVPVVKGVKHEDMQQMIDGNEIKVVYTGNTLSVYIPKTMEASELLGKGTAWCTADPDNGVEDEEGENVTPIHFAYYSEKGPLYVIICKDGNRYQFHFETEQFMDVHDNEVDLQEMLEKYPELYEAFKDIGKEYPRMRLVFEKNPSEEVQLAAVEHRGRAIRYIKNPSEQVQLAAVKQNGYAIKYINHPSEQVKLAAVEHRGSAISYIKNPSEQVQLAAVEQDGDAIAYINHPSEQVQLAAVEQDGRAIMCISRPSEQVQLAAVEQNADSVRYIQEPSAAVLKAAGQQ